MVLVVEPALLVLSVCCLLHVLQMGLGKTAQSISVMAWLRQFGGVTSPFLVVAPLTTLGHWQREIQTWTGMVRPGSCLLQPWQPWWLTCSHPDSFSRS